MRASLTAVIIAKNEEHMIADCIHSVNFCDKVVVIDNNSTDKTAKVAKELGAIVYLQVSDNFAELRNIGLSKVKTEWVLYVDADERVSSLLAQEINSQLSNSKSQELAAFSINRKNFYLGNHLWPKLEKMERLFRTTALIKWEGALHESPKFKGELSQLQYNLLHYTHQDLSQMLNKTIEWSKIEAEIRYHAGHPQMTWWRFPRVMVPVFFDYYIKQQGYKVGTVGLIESIYQSFSIAITYARLWELQQKVN